MAEDDINMVWGVTSPVCIKVACMKEIGRESPRGDMYREGVFEEAQGAGGRLKEGGSQVKREEEETNEGGKKYERAIANAEHQIPKKTNNEKWIKDIHRFSSPQATRCRPV